MNIILIFIILSSDKVSKLAIKNAREQIANMINSSAEGKSIINVI